MGWLKKLTKPISKVLDKIVPNEIKPFLPYAAAFAPYMMGPGAGGIFSGMGINNKMLQRALMSGTLNLGSQLSQEGSEGEFSGLSTLLAGAQGALTAPGAADKLTGMTTQGGLDAAGTVGRQADQIMQGRNLLTRATDTGLAGLSKGAEFLGKGVDILGPGKTEPGLNLATLEAAALPISQGSGDLALADAQLALRDYENEMANQDQLDLIDNDGRRRAIRAAMTAAGHLEEIIVETLGELGLKDGGVVGMKHGGQLVKRGSGRPGYAGITEKIKEYEPFKHTKKIPDIFKEESGLFTGDSSDRVGIYVALISPAIDAVRAIGFAGDIATDIVSKAVELGIDSVEGIVNYAKSFNKAEGGRISKEGGGVASILPKGKEADYRGGGVIPVGSRERADDVPARLSKNEFVMTADAVRAAGGGNINQGAKRMYNLMNNLEARV